MRTGQNSRAVRSIWMTTFCALAVLVSGHSQKAQTVVDQRSVSQQANKDALEKLLVKDDSAAARSIWEQVLTADPTYDVATYNLAWLDALEGNHAKAIQSLKSIDRPNDNSFACLSARTLRDQLETIQRIDTSPDGKKKLQYLRFLEASDLALQNRNSARAFEFAGKACSVLPDRSEAYVMGASILVANAQFDRAKALLALGMKKSTDKDPIQNLFASIPIEESYAKYLRDGIDKIRAKKFHEAEIILQQAISFADRPEARFRLATCLSMQGQISAARAQITSLLNSKDPSVLDQARKRLGRIDYALKLADATINPTKRASVITLDGQIEKLNQNIENSQQTMSRAADSVKYYDEQLARATNEVQRGILNLGKIDKVSEYNRHAEYIKTDRATILELQAARTKAISQPAEESVKTDAQQSLNYDLIYAANEASIGSETRNADLYSMANAAINLKRRDEGKQLLARAIASNDTRFETRRFYANLLVEEGLYRQATPIVEKLLIERPKAVEVQYYAAKCLRAENRLNESVKMLDSVARATGPNPLVYAEISNLWQAIGNYKEAENAAKRAEKTDRWNPKIQIQLARLALVRNRLKDAQKYATNAANLGYSNASELQRYGVTPKRLSEITGLIRIDSVAEAKAAAKETKKQVLVISISETDPEASTVWRELINTNEFGEKFASKFILLLAPLQIDSQQFLLEHKVSRSLFAIAIDGDGREVVHTRVNLSGAHKQHLDNFYKLISEPK